MKRESENKGGCPVCGYPEDECVCCPECGHVCPLDAGEDFCPVCSPRLPGRPGEGEKGEE